MLFKIIGRAFHFFFCQHIGDLMCTVPFNCQAKYPADYCSCFFINQPVTAVFRIFLVTINRNRRDVFSIVALCL